MRGGNFLGKNLFFGIFSVLVFFSFPAPTQALYCSPQSASNGTCKTLCNLSTETHWSASDSLCSGSGQCCVTTSLICAAPALCQASACASNQQPGAGSCSSGFCCNPAGPGGTAQYPASQCYSIGGYYASGASACNPGDGSIGQFLGNGCTVTGVCCASPGSPTPPAQVCVPQACSSIAGAQCVGALSACGAGLTPTSASCPGTQHCCMPGGGGLCATQGGTCVSGTCASQNRRSNPGSCTVAGETCCTAATFLQCTGSCRSFNCNAGETEDTTQICSTAADVCCRAGTGGSSCGTGGTCVGQPCAALGIPPVTGTCSSGLFCCGSGASSCSGSCVGQPCAALSLPNGSGTCSSGQFCCGGTAGAPGQSLQAITFLNPLAYGTVNGLLASILTWLQAIVATLALVFITIGGFLYITSGGDTGRIETAKKCIGAAVIGFAIAVAAPSFLREIANIFNWGPNVGNLPGTTLTLLEIFTNVMNFLLSIVGVVAIIMLVVGGMMYLTSAGDEDRIDTGKAIIKYSVIGILVALASLVLLTQLANFF